MAICSLLLLRRLPPRVSLEQEGLDLTQFEYHLRVMFPKSCPGLNLL